MKRKIRKAIAALLLVVAIAVTQIPAANLKASPSASDFVKDGTKLVKYAGTATSVSVPDGITEISAEAFASNTALTSISIPSSVQKIGNSAFYNCTQLTRLDIPSGVISIGTGAFAGCSRLNTVSLSETVREIGSSAFAGDSSLETIAVNASNTAFVCVDGVLYNYDKSNIIQVLAGRKGASYVMPATVSDIEPYAFWGCGNLTSVGLSSLLEEIPAFSFSNCKNLERMAIPFSVHKIRMKAFEDCRNLTDVTIPGSVSEIHATAFDGCYKLNIIADQGTKAYEFFQTFDKSNSAITDYEDTGSVSGNTAGIMTNGDTEDSGNSTQSQTTTSDTLAVSENSISEDNLGMTRIVASQAVVFIDNTSQKVITGGNQEPEVVQTGDGNSQDIPVKYAVLNGNTIANRAFYQNAGLTEYTFPQGITDIGDFSFARSALNSVEIPEGVTHIGYGAFYHCDQLQNISIPSTVKEIEPAAFYNTPYYNNWKNGGSIGDFLVVGDGILLGYKGNSVSVTIPDNVKYIGAETFRDHMEIKQVNLPDSVETVGEDAFNGCQNLTGVTGGNGVKEIKDRAFMNCPLTTIQVAPETQSIGLKAFSQQDSANHSDAVVFQGGSLPVISYEKTATRLSNAEYRDLAVDGVKTAVVDSSVTDFSNTMLDENSLGFRGLVVSISGNGAGQTAQLKYCTLLPDAVTGIVTVPKSVQVKGQTYEITSVNPDAFSPYISRDGWNTGSLTGIVFENQELGQQVGNLSDITFDGSVPTVEATPAADSSEAKSMEVSVTNTSITDKELVSAYLSDNNSDYLFVAGKEDISEKLLSDAVAQTYGTIPENGLFTMDLALIDKNGQVPVTKLGKERLTITIPVPEKMNGQELCIVCLDDNNQLELEFCHYITVDGVTCVQFEAKHFSPYGIYAAQGQLAENIAVKSGASSGNGALDQTPDTGDFVSPKWVLFTGLLAGALYLFLKKDTHNRKKKKQK